MKTVTVLGGPRDGEVVQVPDNAAGVSWYPPPELDAANFTATFAPGELDVLPPVEGIHLPIVSFRTRDRELKLVAAWPLYTWPTRS